jgi:YD repeat-containing protein
MTNPITILLALALLTVAASAQQRTIYDSRGNVVARSATDSSDAVTNYDARGNVVSSFGATTWADMRPTEPDCTKRKEPPAKSIYRDVQCRGELVFTGNDIRVWHSQSEHFVYHAVLLGAGADELQLICRSAIGDAIAWCLPLDEPYKVPIPFNSKTWMVDHIQ